MSKPNPTPPTPAPVTGKAGAFVPHQPVNKGDIIISDTGSWWVSLRNHTTSTAWTLRPGQSDDNWHFSTGPS